MSAVRRLAAASLATAGVAAVMAGLNLAGSPGEARLRRLDERRVSDLQHLASAVDAARMREGRLPATLSALESRGVPGTARRDPATGVPYDYRLVDEDRYELCAVFDRDGGEGAGAVWAHPAGRQCFTLAARVPDR